MKPEALLKEKREEILRIAARHGARNGRVFGSVARGEADAQSDIDLLVEFEPDRSLLDHAALWLELQELLGCKVDVVSEGGVKARIRDRVGFFPGGNRPLKLSHQVTPSSSREEPTVTKAVTVATICGTLCTVPQLQNPCAATTSRRSWDAGD
jgi:predicted nucleotidyltransferase